MPKSVWVTGFCQSGNCWLCPGELNRPGDQPPAVCTCSHHNKENDGND